MKVKCSIRRPGDRADIDLGSVRALKMHLGIQAGTSARTLSVGSSFGAGSGKRGRRRTAGGSCAVCVDDRPFLGCGY